ncbi:transporter, major facilitator family domain containing protein, putative [Eimeria tenella]|uniref:Transporter, major facilitator family domain containing protein, putative n=1 Tax=Eimeria tenella TaxID=5802 RepID=U6KKH4_EIMTE|nr:transporter, major facilitator family domain containing protein, putative [Eimeria tenella]CDJ37321.1 transporter, major facilitator family domain containing protein, putative [Eimeria tenella]|eukprot:XP_013228159.1 transporter, major facilitator family domain containing protein, putative [Eimeria tenella]
MYSSLVALSLSPPHRALSVHLKLQHCSSSSQFLTWGQTGPLRAPGAAVSAQAASVETGRTLICISSSRVASLIAGGVAITAASRAAAAAATATAVTGAAAATAAAAAAPAPSLTFSSCLSCRFVHGDSELEFFSTAACTPHCPDTPTGPAAAAATAAAAAATSAAAAATSVVEMDGSVQESNPSTVIVSASSKAVETAATAAAAAATAATTTAAAASSSSCPEPAQADTVSEAPNSPKRGPRSGAPSNPRGDPSKKVAPRQDAKTIYHLLPESEAAFAAAGGPPEGPKTSGSLGAGLSSGATAGGPPQEYPPEGPLANSREGAPPGGPLGVPPEARLITSTGNSPEGTPAAGAPLGAPPGSSGGAPLGAPGGGVTRGFAAGGPGGESLELRKEIEMRKEIEIKISEEDEQSAVTTADASSPRSASSEIRQLNHIGKSGQGVEGPPRSHGGGPPSQTGKQGGPPGGPPKGPPSPCSSPHKNAGGPPSPFQGGLLASEALGAPGACGAPGEAPRATAVGGPPRGPPQGSRGVYWVFILFFLVEVFINFDAGVVPAILSTLKAQFQLDGTTEGLLGALPYVGLGLCSPFVGRGLTRFSPKSFCLLTMTVNLAATVMFGVAVHRWMLYVSRLLMGLTQAAISIYTPVWVDHFAPPSQLTLWMGLAQGGVVIGTMLGCVTAGVFDAAGKSGFGGLEWRHALAVQFVCLLLLLVGWALTPRSLLEFDLTAAAAAAAADTELVSVASSREEEEADTETEPETGKDKEELLGLGLDVGTPEVKVGPEGPPMGAPQGLLPCSHKQQGPRSRRAQSASGAQGLRSSGRARNAAGSPGGPPASSSAAGDAGEKQGESKNAETQGAPRAAGKEKKQVQAAHRHSDLPEYLKDPLSNFLPLDFFATSADHRRVSRHPGGGPLPRRLEGRHSAFCGCEAFRYTERAFSPGSWGPRGLPVQGGPPGPLMSRAHSAVDSREGERWAPLAGAFREDVAACGAAPAVGAAAAAAAAAGSSAAAAPGPEGVQTFQYQMTFLTPHPTTLAFEALNWASGTQDPMVLVQRDPRQAQAAETAEGLGPPQGPPQGPLEPRKDGEHGSRVAPADAALAAQAAPEGGPLKGPPEVDLELNCREMAQAAAAERQQVETTATSSPRSVAKTYGVGDSVRILFSSPLYVCVTFALCALFFEVTAIQFWSISYFHEVLQYPTATVLVSFNATAATAPILGVLGGGWFIDFVGGYKDERGMRRTMSVLLLWAVGCLLLGVGAGWSSNFWFIVFCMWCILFLGGGILPAATGIVIASVPVEVRAFGSGFCMMIYNVLGYVLGTFLPGILIEAASLLWGMRVIYLWSINGVIGFACACCFLWRLRIEPKFISEVQGDPWVEHLKADSRQEVSGEAAAESRYPSSQLGNS